VITDRERGCLLLRSAPTDKTHVMFYFFRRGEARLRCEVRTDPQGYGYELVIEPPDQVVRVERFEEPDSLNRRWLTVERSLRQDGWYAPGDREAPAPRFTTRVSTGH